MPSASLDPWLENHLVCPRDQGRLVLEGPQALRCSGGHSYPVVDGIPVLLLSEATPTHGVFIESLSQARLATPDPTGVSPVAAGTIDPFVQKMIAATCGNMYIPLIDRLKTYPIPRLRLPRGEGKAFLDIGCSWGRWCVSAACLGYRTVGIDPSLDGVRAARRVARQLEVTPLYVVADARHLPFAAESFDTVFSYSVLQHLERDDVRETAREIGRVLRKDGVSLLQMPNRFGLLNLVYEFRQLFRRKVLFDVHYWLPSDLQSLFSQAIGRTELSVDGFFSLNPQKTDRALLPWRYRIVVFCSDVLRKASVAFPLLTYLADSLYVTSRRR